MPIKRNPAPIYCDPPFTPTIQPVEVVVTLT
jgi:hypothetical protein